MISSQNSSKESKALRTARIWRRACWVKPNRVRFWWWLHCVWNKNFKV